jgi:hypothetical protein
MNEGDKEGIQFKDFLDKSTNLITVFGVLNALFIYSVTIDDTVFKSFLLPSFFILSLLCWLEIILFTIRSDNGSIKYDIFYFLSCSIQLGLIWYFIIKFAPLIVLVGLLGVWMGTAFGLGQLFVRMFSKRLSKLSK